MLYCPVCSMRLTARKCKLILRALRLLHELRGLLLTEKTIMTVKAPKRLLFGPGPSPVAPRVYEAMQQNVVGHLDPFFLQTARRGAEAAGLCVLHGQRIQPGAFRHGQLGHGSGGGEFHRAGHEVRAAEQRILRRPHRRNGAPAGRRSGEALESRGASRYDRRKRASSSAARSRRLWRLCRPKLPPACSTTAKPICEAAHEVDALAIADCVTSLGGMPVKVDENGIDIAYSCSQKGLGCPPGLSPITVSPRALER